MHQFIRIKPRRACLCLVRAEYKHSVLLKSILISGILDATRTSLGRRLLRNWFLRPSLSLPTIAARHNALSCFLRPENLVTANAMHGHLKGIGNIPHVFALLRGGKAGVREWQSVVKVLNGFCQ
jgi:DNA mismatch repair protein MSH5